MLKKQQRSQERVPSKNKGTRGERQAHTCSLHARLPPLSQPPTPTHAPPRHPHTPPSPPYPMTTAAQGDPPPSLLLGPLLGNLTGDLLQQEVLRRLGPTDLASLAGAGRGCAAAVAATALMQWARHAKLAPPGNRDPPGHNPFYRCA